tara:strand:+ start:490 stop:903 length:414 start_codon:yes stop_codon:yes gene_type:complete
MSIGPKLDLNITGPFWQAAARQSLEIPRCLKCKMWVWYPKEACPSCQNELTWTQVSGKGTVNSFTVVRRSLLNDYDGWTPYVPALISLNENPAIRIVSQLVDCDIENLSCDIKVEVVFRKIKALNEQNYLAPLFKPY